MSSIRILFLTMGNIDHASSRVRVMSYFPYVKNDMDCTLKWIPRIPRKDVGFISKILFPILKRILYVKRLLFLFRTWDIVVVQKIVLPTWQLNLLLRKARVIFDMDDAIQTQNQVGVNRMISKCNGVIVASPILKSYCDKLNSNVELITSSVDVNHIFPTREKSTKKVVIGWIGSSSTIKYLHLLKSALRTLSQRVEFSILLVGAENQNIFEGLDVQFEKWEYAKENEFLNQMDIGIMPLPRDDWAEGKGGYKLIQFMASGIPVVASPIGINLEIVTNGSNGFLASNDNEWVESLTKLMEDAVLRKEMGKHGLDMVHEKYSYDANWVRFRKMIFNK